MQEHGFSYNAMRSFARANKGKGGFPSTWQTTLAKYHPQRFAGAQAGDGNDGGNGGGAGKPVSKTPKTPKQQLVPSAARNNSKGSKGKKSSKRSSTRSTSASTVKQSKTGGEGANQQVAETPSGARSNSTTSTNSTSKGRKRTGKQRGPKKRAAQPLALDLDDDLDANTEPAHKPASQRNDGEAGSDHGDHGDSSDSDTPVLVPVIGRTRSGRKVKAPAEFWKGEVSTACAVSVCVCV